MLSCLQFAGMENSVHLLPWHLNCRHGAAVGFTLSHSLHSCFVRFRCHLCQQAPLLVVLEHHCPGHVTLVTLTMSLSLCTSLYAMSSWTAVDCEWI